MQTLPRIFIKVFWMFLNYKSNNGNDSSLIKQRGHPGQSWSARHWIGGGGMLRFSRSLPLMAVLKNSGNCWQILPESQVKKKLCNNFFSLNNTGQKNIEVQIQLSIIWRLLTNLSKFLEIWSKLWKKTLQSSISNIHYCQIHRSLPLALLLNI